MLGCIESVQVSGHVVHAPAGLALGLDRAEQPGDGTVNQGILHARAVHDQQQCIRSQAFGPVLLAADQFTKSGSEERPRIEAAPKPVQPVSVPEKDSATDV